MAIEQRELDVLLGDVPAGRLELDDEGRARFRLFESFRTMYPRPVLGQQFEDDLAGRWIGKGRLPAWFSNLLPEGALREQVRATHASGRKHEIVLLAALGSDLPGAVRVRPAEAADQSESETTYESHPFGTGSVLDDLKFSLAGVQLKFSVLRRETGGMTLPIHGVGGDWILKLPDGRFAGVPQNEHAMMTWASLVGLDVPEVELVDQVENVPKQLFLRGEPAFLVRRFDRGPDGARIHIEDLAQVRGIYPEDKYSGGAYEVIGKPPCANVA